MKTKKSVLGFIGLFLVATITTIAYQLPLPEAEAASAASIEVTAKVPVISDDVKIISPVAGSTVTSNTGDVIIQYQNITSGTVYIRDANGVVIFSAPVSIDATGKATIPYTLPDYGQYTIDFQATHTDGTSIMARPTSFTYNSISSCAPGSKDCTTFPPVCDDSGNCVPGCNDQGVCPPECGALGNCPNVPPLPVDPDCTNTANCNPPCPSGTNCNSGGGDCAHENCSGLPKNDIDNPVITICYDENVNHLDIIVRNSVGEIVHTETVPITDEDRAKGNCKDIEINLDGEDLPDGIYIAEVTAKDKDNNQLGDPIYIRFYYKRDRKIDVPKTGLISFGSLSLSSGDLIVFGVGLAALTSVIFIYYKRKKAAKN